MDVDSSYREYWILSDVDEIPRSNPVAISTELKPDILSDGRYRCMYCDKILKNRFTYNSHRYRHHNIVVRNSVECPVADCDERVTTIVALCDHMQNAHRFELRNLEEDFLSEIEFHDWYEKLAETERCEFVQHTALDAFPDKSVKLILRCNRSGTSKTRLRDFPRTGIFKGSCKMGSTCPAYLRVKTNAEGRISVTGQLNHFGHEIDLHLLHMSDEQRNELQQLLLKGMQEEALELAAESFDTFENNGIHVRMCCPDCGESDLYSCFEFCSHISRLHMKPAHIRRVRCANETKGHTSMLLRGGGLTEEETIKVELFCCNRTRRFYIEDDFEQPSIPVIAGMCTAFIKKITYSSGIVDLVYCSYHLEHDAEISLPPVVKSRLNEFFMAGFDENFALALLKEEFKNQLIGKELCSILSEISLADARILRERAFECRKVNIDCSDDENSIGLRELSKEAFSDEKYAIVFSRGELFGDELPGVAFGFMTTFSVSLLHEYGRKLVWVDKAIVHMDSSSISFIGFATSINEKRHCMIAYLLLQCPLEIVTDYVQSFVREVIAVHTEIYHAAWCPKFLLTDDDEIFAKVVEAINMSDDSLLVDCEGENSEPPIQRLRSLNSIRDVCRAKFGTSEIGDGVIAFIDSLARSSSRDIFEENLNSFVQYLEAAEDERAGSFLQYFSDCWLSYCGEWSNFHVVDEGIDYNALVKWISILLSSFFGNSACFLSRSRPLTLHAVAVEVVRLATNLDEDVLVENDASAESNPSSKLRWIHREHRLARDMVEYTTKRTPIVKLVDFDKRQFVVTLRERGKIREVTVSLVSSQCVQELVNVGLLCKMRCLYKSCGACVHMFKCSCWLSKWNDGILCRHCHVLLPWLSIFPPLTYNKECVQLGNVHVADTDYDDSYSETCNNQLCASTSNLKSVEGNDAQLAKFNGTANSAQNFVASQFAEIPASWEPRGTDSRETDRKTLNVNSPADYQLLTSASSNIDVISISCPIAERMDYESARIDLYCMLHSIQNAEFSESIRSFLSDNFNILADSIRSLLNRKKRCSSRQGNHSNCEVCKGKRECCTEKAASNFGFSSSGLTREARIVEKLRRSRLPQTVIPIYVDRPPYSLSSKEEQGNSFQGENNREENEVSNLQYQDSLDGSDCITLESNEELLSTVDHDEEVQIDYDASYLQFPFEKSPCMKEQLIDDGDDGRDRSGVQCSIRNNCMNAAVTVQEICLDNDQSSASFLYDHAYIRNSDGSEPTITNREIESAVREKASISSNHYYQSYTPSEHMDVYSSKRSKVSCPNANCGNDLLDSDEPVKKQMVLSYGENDVIDVEQCDPTDSALFIDHM